MPNSSPPTQPADRVLLLEELNAFEILHRDALDRCARRLVGPQVASELVGKALIELRSRIHAGHPPRINNDEHVKNLIYFAVKAECRDYIRKTTQLVEFEAVVRDVIAPDETDIEAEVANRQREQTVFRRVESLPPVERTMFDLRRAGKTVKDIATALGLEEHQVDYKLKRMKTALMSALAALLASLKRKPWLTASAVALLVFLFMQKPEPSCRTTAGDGYVVRYCGDCAIGFMGVEHPDLKSAPSLLPGAMIVLHGAAWIGIASDNQPFVDLAEGSYAVLVNRHDDHVIQFCEGTTCRDVAPHEYARTGTRPLRWKHTPASLEDLVTAGVNQPVTPRTRTAPRWIRTARGGIQGFSVSLANGKLSYPEYAFPLEGVKCSGGSR